MEFDDFEEKLKERILTLNKTIWENKISGIKIKNWLSNFTDDTEKKMALYLLSEFMYFGDMQMRVLLKTLYRDLYRYPIIKNIRKSNYDKLDSKFIEDEFDKILKKTRFIGVGNPSESGAHLLYFFRQENKLSKKNFINSFDLNKDENKDITKIVFLDDFCGSGGQATDKEYTEFIDKIKFERDGIEIDYLMLVGTTNGIKTVIDSKIFNNVDTVIKLDNSFKCFENESRYFNNINLPFILSEVKDFSKKYGYPLMNDFFRKNGHTDCLLINQLASKNSLGFGDCQLLLGFNHNTPDNSLPIFWYDEEEIIWTPIFKRYNKKYNF